VAAPPPAPAPAPPPKVVVKKKPATSSPAKTKKPAYDPHSLFIKK
jgi:hypothetical protein